MADNNCSMNDCERPVHRKGLCSLHYNRRMTRGSEYWLPPTDEQRFWRRVNKNGPIPKGVPHLGQCWIWTGPPHDENGYVSVRVNGRGMLGHRYSWELANGPIPPGLHVDHLCRNTMCVRDTHLEPVPPAINMLRGASPASLHGRKTHCIRDHEFTPENTIMFETRSGGPGRQCKACNVLRSQGLIKRVRPTVPCAFADCERMAVAKALCDRHYRKSRRHSKRANSAA